ncbi:MAG: hypothetical protein UV28_C0022G0013 [Candidatus Collierbacteria bacterium GW2011_GWE2_42_48]|uniref:Uncharacterized protein n=1 Tax=Candidatus Collierbacteria bacterium GW2011_GWA2_42_17 TaxID=1618378 RepID=A0A0G0Z116_9BACT|nr:MAG: hypothetical protein UV06_C0012G0005 [Candidatus Collierbacteria bacterium GW2011_GWA2_42_17]KKS61909.1 MAG: hypothetical protein UV28_C0022G0013 [Candidatus Collierbacteria bacterium GW2011_GWE2_42_48]HCW31238.1 hypothetical protein [Candidatus Collierbacteria bacterium]
MPIPKIEITNPQALEIMGKVKSGEIFIPLATWFKKSKWYLISILIVTILLIALVVGKNLSEKTPVPVFAPPDIESITPPEVINLKSDFSGLKEEIQNLNTDLPDPFIPTFDDNLKLEEVVN